MAKRHNSTSSAEPRRLLICLSGKRRSGKDFLASRLRVVLPDLIQEMTGGAISSTDVRIDTVGISFLLKENFARIHGLDAERLKSDEGFKETFRREMVDYGERIRIEDVGFFCREALRSVVEFGQSTAATVHVIVVSDCRRSTDLLFFQHAAAYNFNPELCKKREDQDQPSNVLPARQPIFVRIEASKSTRHLRGYRFVTGIDDAPTECSLDAFDAWDVRLQNDGVDTLLCESLREIASLCVQRLAA